MKRTSILDLYEMKKQGVKATWVTAYDVFFASYAQQAGVDIILVGDSMGKFVYGMNDTLPVTMEMCLNHTQAVRKGALQSFVLGDMPYGSYQVSIEEALRNAIGFVKEADVDAIKLEGGKDVAPVIKALNQAGIPVFAHIGLVPQCLIDPDGFSNPEKLKFSAKVVIEDALATYEAGATAILLASVPEEISKYIHELIPIPVYGINSGRYHDGECAVSANILGFSKNGKKSYSDLASIITHAYETFVKDVKNDEFHEKISSKDMETIMASIKQELNYY